MRSRIAPILLEAMLIALGGPVAAATPAAAARASLDEAAAARFAALALKCLHQQYPNHISHTLGGDADARAPRELTPAFYGCYDWHSAVHAHWLLVRLIRLIPDAPFAPEARAAVAQSLAPANIEAEVRYLRGAGRASFERPYGLAWLLELAAELRRFDDPDAKRWSATLRPLETETAARLEGWLPKLHYPIRIGEHDQTARADPKLAHIDGLNLSRAWMLEGIARGLPAHDARVAALTAAAARHRDAALPAVTGEHYEGGHWLGTFAVYLTSRAGLAQ